ncbi:MAG: hexameric tyrosine-coordinated heme protein [Trueperaceae bacterium]
MQVLRDRLREDYASNFDSLIAISSVVAINLQTITTANEYWRTSN